MRFKAFYIIVRDLHLYGGLFISPFVLAFAISVFFLVHAWLPGGLKQSGVRTVGNLTIPAGVELLSGRERINALRGLLGSIGVDGEVGSIRSLAQDHRLLVPVSVPGSELVVDLNLNTGSAVITERSNSVWSAVVDLHKTPGPHNVNIRDNWLYMGIWKWLADATVYLVMFISISGIYLWAVLRAERRTGLAMLAAGTISFFGMVYALSH